MLAGARSRTQRQALAIGLLLALPQFASAQDGSSLATGGVGWITAKDERVRERFRQLLLAAPTRDLGVGWQLALDLGRPAAPLLWEMLQAEKSNVESRLIVLAAAVLAGGVAEDARLFEWLDQQKPMLEERVLASMVMALGPMRSRPVPNFWTRCLGPTRSPELLLSVAVRLASVRFPGAEDGAPALQGDDPGLVAAAAFSGTGGVAAHWWNLTTPERHAELVWRGSLLGSVRRWRVGGAAPEPSFEVARQMLGFGGDLRAPLRSAAALLLAHGQQFRAEEPRLDWPLLQAAVSDPRTNERLAAWLGPKAQPRDEQPSRLAVAYALSRPTRTVVDERSVWGSEPAFRQHVAVALAFRLLAQDAPQPTDATLPGVAEWQFVRFACGAPVERGQLPDDPHLRVAMQLAADGRMPRAALRTALEEALWRWDCHPGLIAWQQERLLVRDLLLAGSAQGGGKYLPQVRADQRYVPGGLDRKDGFFGVAVQLYDFLAVPRAPIPAERRLGG